MLGCPAHLAPWPLHWPLRAAERRGPRRRRRGDDGGVQVGHHQWLEEKGKVLVFFFGCISFLCVFLCIFGGIVGGFWCFLMFF